MLLFIFSCNKEDDLSPSNNPEDLIEFPQGDHDYDNVIMDWYEAYGFTALYIFEPKDVYWGNESWYQGDFEYIDYKGGTEIAKQGEEEYIGFLCDMFDKLFLSNYPQELLHDVMPFRVFLCSSLYNYEYDWSIGGYAYSKIWMYEGWDNIAVNGASRYITDTLTRQDQINFSHDLNMYFLQKLVEKKLFVAPEEFYDVSEYDTQKSYGGLDLFEQGYVHTVEYAVRKEQDLYKEYDFLSYMRLLAYPLEYLEDGDVEEDVDYDEPSLSGIFKRPEAVKVKEKYDILVNALKNIGINVINLQSPPTVDY